MIDALLIYPRLGTLDTMVVDLPLSIIYAAADSVKRGHRIELLDLRVLRGNWKSVLKERLAQGVRLVGVSVMTGQPLISARDISRLVRQCSPETKIVWGGPHVTILPETVKEDFIDFLIRGYGSSSLADLLDQLKSDRPNPALVKGLSYKKNGRIVHNDRPPFHEILSYKELPYHLINVLDPGYQRAYSGKLMFTIFSSIGCPYKCTFCVHPTVYQDINPPKWIPLPVEEVVGHIEYAYNRFGARNICFLDDTSFPDLKRMRLIFALIIEQGLKVTLEFRGARINELDRMDDDFIRLMIKAGARVLKVGAESGSDRLLNIFQKGISKEQIVRVNRKFARYPELVVDYNFFCGAPGETYDDLRETKDMVIQLIRENPRAYYSWGSDWKPIPGSKLLEKAVQEYNFRVPRTMDEWAEMDSFDSKRKIVHPWYTPKHNNLIKIMQLSGLAIDNKIRLETATNKDLAYRLLRLLSRLYRPLAMFRLKRDLYDLPFEYELYRLMLDVFPRLTASPARKND
ncbi:MAG: radical SAM protein [Thermodesulfobacteriota bacterium]